VCKGGRVICGGIHMSDMPRMPYAVLWEERELISVANLTRHDAEEFFPVAARALADLGAGRLSGAAVLVP
jgi:alcohol dehydrogenase, propanol-preferring